MEGHHEQLGYTCRSCNRQDPSKSNLISCDQCRQWEHFNCTGVSDTLQSCPFICKQCQEKDVVGSTISTRLRSKTKRVPSGKESGSKPASNVGSKVSSVGSSNRSSVVKARLKLIEEEEQIKQKELDEEEAMKKLEHDEAQRQLEQRKKQIEEQAKLMEQESLLRQRKLEADKARLMKQQLIRRESLEKKNEILLQISERGSVVESSASSLEKVSDWLARNLPHGTTGDNASENRNERQTELISTAPEEVSPMTIEEPVIKASVSIPPERLRRDQTTALCFPQVPPAGMTGVDFDQSGFTNRVRFQGIQSTTVREPFQRFVASAKPSQPYSAAVYPNSSQNQQTFIPCHDGRIAEQPTHCQQRPSGNASMRGVIPSPQTVSQSFCEPHPDYRHPSGVPDRHSTLINLEDRVYQNVETLRRSNDQEKRQGSKHTQPRMRFRSPHRQQ
nr:stress response protein nst1-like [Aedes albopictus]